MKTCLLIHSFQGATEAIKRHWPYWQRAGCDIVGIGRTNTKCWWPDGVKSYDIGEDSYVDGDNHCRRIIDTFRLCLTPEFDQYTDFCVIEYDCLILKPLPPHPGGFYTLNAVGGMPGFKANQGFHCPWWVDKPMAKKLVECGDIMIAEGDIERGTIDLFLGWMIDRFNIPWTDIGLQGFSRNSIDNARYFKEAWDALDRGIWCIHGIKHEHQLKIVMGTNNHEVA